MPTKPKPRRKHNAKITRRVLQMIPGYDPFATAGDCTFDQPAAELACGFFEDLLTHVKGDYAKTPLILEPWEVAIVANLFGWKRPDGTRRYREAFIFVPRKNAKTTLSAGICNYVLFCDGEPGAEIYCAAGKRDQAKILFSVASGMINNEPELKKRSKLFRASNTIVLTETDEEGHEVETETFFRAISAEASTAHGFNPHLVIVDELHAQPNRDLVDALSTGMGARSQPLFVSITTSDYDRPSICNEKHDYASKVRDGIIENESYLPVIYEAGRDDDWKAPKTWKKSNPNMGVSFKQSYIAAECKKAQDDPTYENTFKRLHLNLRTEQAVRWIQMDTWDACQCEIDPATLAGKPCWGGIDLSQTTDITSCALAWPNVPEEGHYTIAVWSWLPRERAWQRFEKNGVPYPQWAGDGFIELTDGNVIDYGFVRRRISGHPKDVPPRDGEGLALVDQFNVQDIGYDPYNATQLCTNELAAEDGLEMVEFRQGYLTMNEPCKQLERLLVGGMLHFDTNPVLRWAASNICVRPDAAGNLKPDKDKSSEKIDPLVAVIIAIGRAMFAPIETPSVYTKRGIIVLE